MVPWCLCRDVSRCARMRQTAHSALSSAARACERDRRATDRTVGGNDTFPPFFQNLFSPITTLISIRNSKVTGSTLCQTTLSDSDPWTSREPVTLEPSVIPTSPTKKSVTKLFFGTVCQRGGILLYSFCQRGMDTGYRYLCGTTPVHPCGGTSRQILIDLCSEYVCADM